ncbi:Elongation factor Ts, mitochondrial [Capsicum chinense]|nr:Elongation factor Ts, mitochondrial [Capsicum chinense]
MRSLTAVAAPFPPYSEAAQKDLRKRGIVLASKKSSRTAAEGLLALAQNEKKAAVIELNCETDFVARNEIFQYLASSLAKLALLLEGSGQSFAAFSVGHLEELKLNLDHPKLSGEKSVQNAIAEVAAMMGENVKLRRGFAVSAPSLGVISTYLHTSPQPGVGVTQQEHGSEMALKVFGLWKDVVQAKQSHQKETFSVNRCHIVFAMPKQSIRRSPVPPLSSAADIWTMFLTLLDCNGLCHAMSGKLLSAGISWKVEDSIQKIWSMVPATILWCLWMERNQRFFDGVGRIAGMLSLEVEDKNVSQDALQRVGSELAMHVVAAKPLFLTKEDVSSDALHNEREILKSQAESSGKPQIAIEKMVEGRLRKYFEEVVFMEQKFIVNDTMSVKVDLPLTSVSATFEFDIKIYLACKTCVRLNLVFVQITADSFFLLLCCYPPVVVVPGLLHAPENLPPTASQLSSNFAVPIGIFVSLSPVMLIEIYVARTLHNVIWCVSDSSKCHLTLLSNLSKDVGSPVKIGSFLRMEVGEGLQGAANVVPSGPALSYNSFLRSLTPHNSESINRLFLHSPVAADMQVFDGNRPRLARSIAGWSVRDGEITRATQASPSGGCCAAHGSIVHVYDWMLEERCAINLDYNEVNNLCWIDSENIVVSTDGKLGSGGMGLFNASTGELRFPRWITIPISKQCKQLQWLHGTKCLMVSSFNPRNSISLFDVRKNSVVWSWSSEYWSYYEDDQTKQLRDVVAIEERSSICVVDWNECLGFMDLRSTNGVVNWRNSIKDIKPSSSCRNDDINSHYDQQECCYPKLAFPEGQLFSSMNDTISVHCGSDWVPTSQFQQSRGGPIWDFSIGGDRLFALHRNEYVLDVWDAPRSPVN